MTNDTTPATKADLAALAATLATKAELASAVAELKRYFDVMVETMRHDFQDAYHDGYQVLRDGYSHHERRIARLERHAGVVA